MTADSSGEEESRNPPVPSPVENRRNPPTDQEIMNPPEPRTASPEKAASPGNASVFAGGAREVGIDS